ncbi:MAG TPA: hypothetical protein VGK74_02460 [Symbiobacteriaceae bacterium]
MPQTGRGPWVSDSELLDLLVQEGSITRVTRAAGYVDHCWVARRLRRAGVPPGRSGAGPKPENTALPADDMLLQLFRELRTIRAVAAALGHTNRDHVRKRLRELGIAPGRPGRQARREATA